MFSRWLDADGRVSASLGTSDVQISGKTSVARKHGESVRQQTVTKIGQREAQAIRDHHGYVDSRWKRHHSAIPDASLATCTARTKGTPTMILCARVNRSKKSGANHAPSA